ncbi:uncharacterized protein [Nicotiana tomentosiformis]|uniref:uncharacterized protein n=1 Tax=Nicotiana tomentosiformis TaxID=4098 RepID=UPI00051C4B50|nr:uncharacterized protein LOC104089099 [Nicotiana tomentosiformis]
MNSFKLYLPILVLLQILTSSLATLYPVSVANILNAPLTIHCIAQGQNVSRDNAPAGFVLNMSIDTNLANPTATCQLSSGNLHGNFVVFDSSKEPNRCFNGRCLWQARPDGLYLVINGQFSLVYKWP